MADWSQTPAPVKVLRLTQWNGTTGFDDKDGSLAVAGLKAILASKCNVICLRASLAPINLSIAARMVHKVEEMEMELLLDDSELVMKAAKITTRDIGVENIDYATA